MYFLTNRASDLNIFSEEPWLLSGFKNFLIPVPGDFFSVSFQFRG